MLGWRQFVAILLLVAGCRRKPAESASIPCVPAALNPAFRYSDRDVPLPQHLLSSTLGTVAFNDNAASSNPVTNAGAALGRILFYDPRLSADNHLACASCHQQQFGFADTARFSRGLGGNRPGRHTMALTNVRFSANGRYFWDERAQSLEVQGLEVITDAAEMGSNLDSLEKKIGSTPFYPPIFSAAFGSPQVTGDRIAGAIAQFERSLISSTSRLDAVFSTGASPDFSRLTADELRGYQLFNTRGCANCHRSIVQFADRANNTGLDILSADSGAGRGRFKPPSLRNVAVRPPYMHDGRFRTLTEVVQFYSRGVRKTADLDLRLRNSDGSPRHLDLKDREVEQLVAYLRALTDTAFLTDPRFANPFPAGCIVSRNEKPSAR